MNAVKKVVQNLILLLLLVVTVISVSVTYAYFTDRVKSQPISVAFSFIDSEISFDGGETYSHQSELNLQDGDILSPAYNITTGSTLVRMTNNVANCYIRTHAGYTLDESKIAEYNLTAGEIKKLTDLCIALNNFGLDYYSSSSSHWVAIDDYYYLADSSDNPLMISSSNPVCIFEDEILFPDLNQFNLDLSGLDNLDVLMFSCCAQIIQISDPGTLVELNNTYEQITNTCNCNIIHGYLTKFNTLCSVNVYSQGTLITEEGESITLSSVGSLEVEWYSSYSGGVYSNYVGSSGDTYTPTESLTLYAKYANNNISFVFRDTGAISGNAPSTTDMIIPNAGPINLNVTNTLSRLGYAITAWQTTIDNTTYTYNISSNSIAIPLADINPGIIIFEPVWTEITYQVSLYAPDATISDSSWTYAGNDIYQMTYSINTNPITLPMATYEGNLRFFGWRVQYVDQVGTMWRIGDRYVSGAMASGYYGNVRLNADLGEFGFINTDITKTYGDANFTNPLLNDSTYTPVFTSSNTSVATVNSATGEVTIRGCGDTTIYATIAQENENIENSYTLHVNKANLTITIQDRTITYGDNIPNWNYTINGLVYNETLASLGVNMVVVIRDGNNVIIPDSYTNVGVYSIYPDIQLDNYNITAIRGILTINARNISTGTISGIESSYEYTGSQIIPNYTLTVNGRTLVENTDFVVSYQNSIRVGTATITFTGINNYTGTKSTTYSIRKKTGILTISSSALTMEYGDTEYLDVNYVGDGTVSVSVSIQSSRFTATLNNARDTITLLSKYYTGTATITVSATEGTEYTKPANVTCTVTLTRRHITFTSGSASKVYDGYTLRNSDVTITSGSLANFDGVADTYTTPTITGSQREIGSSDNTFNVSRIERRSQGRLNVTSYYDITLVYGTLTVTSQIAELTLDSYSDTIYYGESTSFNFSYNGDGEVSAVSSNSDIASVSISGSRITVQALKYSASQIIITVQASAGTLYSTPVEQVFTLNILRRNITVTSSNSSNIYDGNAHYLHEASITNGTLANFNGVQDSINYTFTGSQTNIGTTSNTFTSTITRNNVNVTNYYNITYVYGTIEVTDFVATISLSSSFTTLTYGDTTTVSFTYDGDGVTSIIVSDNSLISATLANNTITITAIGYSAITQTIRVCATAGTAYRAADDAVFSVNIAKKEITLQSETASKNYDGSPLTNHNASIITGSLASYNSITDDISYSFTGTQTEIGRTNNTFTVTITHNNVDVTSCYDITYVYGMLNVIGENGCRIELRSCSDSNYTYYIFYSTTNYGSAFGALLAAASSVSSGTGASNGNSCSFYLDENETVYIYTVVSGTSSVYASAEADWGDLEYQDRGNFNILIISATYEKYTYTCEGEAIIIEQRAVN